MFSDLITKRTDEKNFCQWHQQIKPIYCWPSSASLVCTTQKRNTCTHTYSTQCSIGLQRGPQANIWDTSNTPLQVRAYKSYVSSLLHRLPIPRPRNNLVKTFVNWSLELTNWVAMSRLKSFLKWSDNLSICLDFLWNIEFESIWTTWLSQMRDTCVTYPHHNSLSNIFSQICSQVVEAIASYSTSALDLATMFCVLFS